MEMMNWLAILVAALVPMVMGFLWYGPMLFQNAWMKESGVTKEQAEGGNMPMIFGLAFLLSFMLAVFLPSIVVHIAGVAGLVGGPEALADPNNPAGVLGSKLIAEHGGNFRTFGHGAFHGVLLGIFIVLPIMGTNALFERKSLKYVLINVGYWTITLAGMCAIISGWQ